MDFADLVRLSESQITADILTLCYKQVKLPAPTAHATNTKPSERLWDDKRKQALC